MCNCVSIKKTLSNNNNKTIIDSQFSTITNHNDNRIT